PAQRTYVSNAKARDASVARFQALKSPKQNVHGRYRTIRAEFSRRAAPDFPGSRSRRACREGISLHEPILFHVGMDNVSLDFHPTVQYAQPRTITPIVYKPRLFNLPCRPCASSLLTLVSPLLNTF